MNRPPGGDSDTPRYDPLAALRQPNFLLYTASRFLSSAAMTMMQAVILWQVYQLTGSPLQLGMIGLVRFLPALGLSLVGGAYADTHDRRAILFAAQVFPFAGSLALFLTTRADIVGLPLIYAVVLVTALSSAFEAPARQALLPSLVDHATFSNAITVSSTAGSLAFVTGPALAGVIIGWGSVSGAYGAHLVLIAAGALLLPLLRPRPFEGERRSVSVAMILEGVQFVWQRQVLLGSMTLDMFAVIFGGAKALLPIYAADILHVGPQGFGLLSASMDLGALLMSVALVLIPPIERTGRALLLSVAAFGVTTIVFGLSRSFPLSLAAYMAVGMADQVSVVMRQTTIQLATPDELRGRVSSVNMVFIGASNQLGGVESGFVAAVTNATFAVVSGGAGCLAVLALIAARMPELRHYRIGRSRAAPVTIDVHPTAPPSGDTPAT
ncbi:MAG: MFS transporter [Dehalococcoidia bacterium]|nr:MFS transporter [Dehalococcoidia bacterium]